MPITEIRITIDSDEEFTQGELKQIVYQTNEACSSYEALHIGSVSYGLKVDGKERKDLDGIL